MDLALSTWLVKDYDVEQAIELLADTGFEWLEMSCAASPLGQLWEQDAARAQRLVQGAGMQITSVHDPDAGRFLDVADDAQRRAGLEATMAYFRYCAEVDAKLVVVHPTSRGTFSSPQELAAVFRRSRESLAELADLAGELGIRMAAENLPAAGSCERPDGSVAGLLQLIDGLGEHVGICLDIGHTWMSGYDPVKEIHAAGAKLFTLHIHDVRDRKHDHYVPGEGELDFAALLLALKESDFSGTGVLEVGPHRGMPTDSLAALRELHRVWASL
ncbi:MAG: sugar phosphate isomerase/epimerase [Victivallales bacterium]|jgi:fructoselysine 3-epimerase|nr:sugar phosphate isomerase/epimerase [Victivallales bacterium]